MRSVDVNASMIGIVNGMYFLAMLVSSLLLPKIINKLKPYLIITLFLSFSALAVFMFPFWEAPAMFFFLMAVIGMGIGFNFTIIQTLLNQIKTASSQATGIYAFCFAIGFGISTAVGAQLYVFSKYLAFSMAALMITIDIVIVFWSKIDIYISAQHDARKHHSLNMLPIYFAAFLYGYIETSFSSFYPLFLSNSISIQMANFMLSLFVVGGVIGMIPLLKFSQYLKFTKSCSFYAIISLLSISLLMTSKLTFVMSLVGGAFSCALYPISLSEISNITNNETAILNATKNYTMLYSIGCLAGPATTGLFTEYIHPMGLFILSDVVLIIFIILLFYFRKKMQGGYPHAIYK
jgi:MFS family permease